MLPDPPLRENLGLSRRESGGLVVVLTTREERAYFACNSVYARTFGSRPAMCTRELSTRDIHTTRDFIVDNQSGERLELTKVDRRQMGAYLCIAKNEVPPAVSKRVYLRVNCE